MNTDLWRIPPQDYDGQRNDEDACPVCDHIDCQCPPEEPEPNNETGDHCEHKYAERMTAPLGVTCIKCGHFIGAHE